MALPDLTGQNIENTYQRVLQTDGTIIYDGTGSVFLPVSASYSITASYAEYAVSASHEITHELSSSYADYAKESGLATSSISASYALTASYALNSPDVFPYTGSAIISGSLGITGSIDYLNDGNGTIRIGENIAPNAVNMNNTIAIGREILNSTTSGTYAGQSTSVYIGHEVGKNVGATSNYGASVWIGYQAGLNRGGAAPYNTTLIGCQAGTGGYSSVAIGKSAMTNGGVGSIGIGQSVGSNNSGASAILIGDTAGAFASSTATIAIGYRAGAYSGPNYSVVIGHEAGQRGGLHNSVVLGYKAGEYSNGSNNVALGYNAITNTSATNVVNTIAIGYQAGYISSGSNNILLGYQAGYNLTGSNQLIIANNSSSALVTGDFANSTFNISGSVSASTYYGDGSNLTGIETDPFPYTGSAVISGSLEVTGSISSTDTVTAVTGSFSHLKGNSPITVQDPVTFQHGDGIDILGPVTASQIQLGTATIYSGSTRTSIGVGRTPYYYAGNNAVTADAFYSYNGGSAGAPALYLGSNGGGAGRGIYAVSHGIAFSANNSTIAYIRGRTNDSSGNNSPRIGIGVDPSAHIDLSAHINSTRNLLRISGSSAATHAEAFFISSSGNTGIGTWSPNYKLEVVGDVSASTYYGDGSNLTGISSDPFPYTGDVEITGSNSLAGNYAFKVANSSGTDLLKAENDGKVYLRNPSHTSGDINSTGSIVHYGNLTLGPVTSNAPDRKLTIAGYDGAQVEFNLHNGWGKPTIEAHYNGTIKYINYGANSTNLAFQFGESVSRQGSMRFYTNSDEAIKFGTNTGYPLAYIGVVEQPNNYNGGLVIKSRNGTTQTNTWTFGRYGDLDAPGNITASGHISASTYYGDGSNLTGISSDPFPYTGSAVISGSLTLTGSFNALLPTSSTDTYFVTYNTASYELEARQVATLINPKVEYLDVTASIFSGTSITLPNGLSYISSSTYEYLEVFFNGLRLRYDRDFVPTSTTTIQNQIAFPSGSELTFKSLKA